MIALYTNREYNTINFWNDGKKVMIMSFKTVEYAKNVQSWLRTYLNYWKTIEINRVIQLGDLDINQIKNIITDNEEYKDYYQYRKNFYCS